MRSCGQLQSATKVTDEPPHSNRLVSGDLIPNRVVRARDEDAFRHQAIASRVADLVTTAEPPFNVALFGPWGSGKSSFGELLRQEISERAPSTAFVVYDAWKYSGDALQRSFLTEVASALGVGDHVAITTLSQEVEGNQLDLKRVDARLLRALGRWSLLLVVPFLAAVLCLSALIVSLLVGTNRSVRRELLRVIPTWIVGPAFVAGLLAVFLKLIVDSSTVKVREGPPSDERFETRFRSILVEAQKKGVQRFVFFIDELNRVPRNR